MAKQLFRSPQGQRPRQRGLTVLWIIVFFIVLLSFGAIGLEMAWLRVNQTRAQTAAEAASLAAVAALNEGRQRALGASIEMAGANQGAEGPVILTGTDDNSGGDVVFGRWNPTAQTFEHALLAPDAIQVTVRLTESHANGPVPLIFGGLMGFDHANVSARAMAHRAPKQPVPIAMWVTESLQPRAAFIKHGSELDVNGVIAIQSTSARALTIQNGGILRATMLNMEGGIAVDSNDAVHGMLNEEPETPHVPMLPHISLHSLPLRMSLVDSPGVHLLQPGHYPSGLVASVGRYMVEDGVFLFGGPGIELTGQARLASRNAIIFLDEGTHFEVDNAKIKLQGSAKINGINNNDFIVLAAAPDANPEFIFEDSIISIDGMLHAPLSTLEARDTTVSCFKMAVDSITLDLGSSVTVGEDEPHPIDLLLVQ